VSQRGHRILEGVRDRRERHRQRSRVVRAAVVLAGFVVILVGLALIPLPGPGVLVIAVGLAVLALEFAWAERLLEKTVDRMGEASDAVKRASLVQRALLGLLGFLVAAAAVTVAYTWDVPLLPV